jgi:hypothetical protein
MCSMHPGHSVWSAPLLAAIANTSDVAHTDFLPVLLCFERKSVEQSDKFHETLIDCGLLLALTLANGAHERHDLSPFMCCD